MTIPPSTSQTSSTHASLELAKENKTEMEKHPLREHHHTIHHAKNPFQILISFKNSPPFSYRFPQAHTIAFSPYPRAPSFDSSPNLPTMTCLHNISHSNVNL